MKNILLFRHFVCLLLVGFCSLCSVPILAQNGQVTDHVELISGGVNLGPWKNDIPGLSQALTPTTDEPPRSLVLAAERTTRPDILRRFNHYHGGLNITDRLFF